MNSILKGTLSKTECVTNPSLEPIQWTESNGWILQSCSVHPEYFAEHQGPGERVECGTELFVYNFVYFVDLPLSVTVAAVLWMDVATSVRGHTLKRWTAD